MKPALLVLGTLAWTAPLPAAEPPGQVVQQPVAPAKAPVLRGETTAPAILASRAKFRDYLALVQLTKELKARWQAVRRPCTLVAVFGSWCGDSHRQLPALLALEAQPNPFIEIHYLGVARDMKLEVQDWPRGCVPQKVERVPTFYLFAAQPGGGLKLAGKVVETPPRAGQTMAEALLELLEKQVGTR